MRGPREVLHELRWREGALEAAEIHYVHRGAPGGSRMVSGAEVVAIERSFLVLRDPRGERRIPFHRVYRIDVGGEVRFERPRQRSAPDDDGRP